MFICVRYALLLSDFNQTSVFPTDFTKNTQISNYMINFPLGAESFHADERTKRQTCRSWQLLLVILQRHLKLIVSCRYYHSVTKVAFAIFLLSTPLIGHYWHCGDIHNPRPHLWTFPNLYNIFFLISQLSNFT